MATTKKADQPDQPKAPYTVLSPLDHNNVRYEIGETVDLTAQQGESLVRLGIVEAEPADTAAA